ncbi:aldo/keto reductase [Paenibacillus harenae]|uniref:Aryl-alcohol dehydrogenase-like predicted oxidoreductase n=1 Tax=Paenibacillus harenae TaxID=306543 RepID=A0ABT9TY33_PAEHA|nr:aldo/keto reductase [Paenibacillus harenae]MDQ0060213.1 aryl-alcohol dehydrogenase-like predicted oxidoreductase [Paenibacillus harenae]MDQ0112251.1 aryl-alcohol dehydrogenase-like predicted oxidoreductase [Paenibacillus harenae]
MTNSAVSASAAGIITVGDGLKVNRLGFGAMQLTGPGVWGEPKDLDEAIRVLRRAVELGVNFIDTADSYGPFISEQLIKQALHPYKDGLIIATKVGLTRPGPNQWVPVGRPEYLRQQVELCLRHLGLDRIDLLQLHRIDPKVPLEEQIGELALLQKEGKIRYIGLSEVSVPQIEAARKIAQIVSVQNLYNLAKRDAEPVLEYCEAQQIAFIPWYPLATGELAKEDGILGKLSKERGIQPSQLALAWLLKRSPVIMPIPGTSSVAHLEENIAAAGIELSDEDFAKLSNAV